MMDHLRLPPNGYQASNELYLKQLNSNLILEMLSLGKSWHLFEDDGYYYQHIIDHAITADNKNVIEQIATSIEWLDGKMNACKTYSYLLKDLKKCLHHLGVNHEVIQLCFKAKFD